MPRAGRAAVAARQRLPRLRRLAGPGLRRERDRRGALRAQRSSPTGPSSAARTNGGSSHCRGNSRSGGHDLKNGFVFIKDFEAGSLNDQKCTHAKYPLEKHATNVHSVAYYRLCKNELSTYTFVYFSNASTRGLRITTPLFCACLPRHTIGVRTGLPFHSATAA